MRPDWNDLLAALSKSKVATDLTSAALKAVNVMGEAGVPGATSIMEWADDKAFKIGAQGANPGRSRSGIQAVTDGREPTPKIEGHFDNFGENYSGIYDENQSLANVEKTKDDPNLLKIFLGIDENTLLESEHKPTSWTKGDPEQGWRSIKDYSNLDVTSTSDFPYLADKDPSMKDYYVKEWGNLEYDGIVNEINSMRNAVARDEYTPDMAVKRKSFPGLKYDTRVNVGHLTKSIGYDTDKKQYYMSVADVWDFEPELYTKIWGSGLRDEYYSASNSLDEETYLQSSLMQASGKSIGLYDRYYLDDSYMDDWYGSEDEGLDDMESKLMRVMSD